MPFMGIGNKLNKEKKEKKSARRTNRSRRGGRFLVALFLLAFIAIMILARVIPEQPDVLYLPENQVAQIISPVQSFFANAVDSAVAYLRKLKLRSNLEFEFNKLKAEYDQLVYQAMLADELQIKLLVYQDIVGEMSLNMSMQPIMATVIGKDEGNYSATMTINKGKRDGVDDLMAVTVNGAFVGYTIDTKETTARVKTIIDTDASVPALIQTTRDEGNIRGTLGINGEKMCRMYHADDYIPRPGDRVVTSGKTLPIPKGIPIGIIRESTRGMDANKQFIVVEPIADFSHLEYVIVYRYQPVPEGESDFSNSTLGFDFIPLDTPRPVPTIQVGLSSIHAGVTPSVGPDMQTIPTDTPLTTIIPTLIPITTIETPLPAPTITYNDPNAPPTPTPTLTSVPSPTPTVPITIDDLTVEDDE